MAVWYRQTVEGVESDPLRIEPHFDGQTDAELLAAKANGARDKGWTVEYTGPDSFIATKIRWGGASCVREFWTD